MASAYPAGLDSFAVNRADATSMATTHKDDHNDANDAINKIEAELGIAPSGSYSTVIARLDDLAVTQIIGASSNPFSVNEPTLHVRNDWTGTETSGNLNVIQLLSIAKGAWNSSHFVFASEVRVQDHASVNQKTVTGAVNNGSGLIRLTVTGHGYATGDRIIAESVGGVPNAHGSWIVTVVDADTLDLQGSTFAGTFTSGGITTNRAGYTAYLALVGPTVARGGLTGVNQHADDIAGVFVSNNGTAKATDAFYVADNGAISGAQWDTVMSADGAATFGYLLNNIVGATAIRSTAYGASAVPELLSRRARGTFAAPLRAKNGDVLNRLSAAGAFAVDDSTAAVFGGEIARIDMLANEDHTSTGRGTRIGFFNTALGSATIAERARFAPGDGLDFNSGTFGNFQIRLKNQAVVQGMNAAGAAGVNLLKINASDRLELMEGVEITDAKNIVLATGTGTKIGTAITQKLGFWNKTPVVQPAAYTPTNVSADRSFDANATTLDEVADVLGTLIADLQSVGLVG